MKTLRSFKSFSVIIVATFPHTENGLSSAELGIKGHLLWQDYPFIDKAEALSLRSGRLPKAAWRFLLRHRG